MFFLSFFNKDSMLVKRGVGTGNLDISGKILGLVRYYSSWPDSMI